MYKIFLSILIGVSIVNFSFPFGEKLNLYPTEFAYYLAGGIVFTIAILTMQTIYKGLTYFENKIDKPKPRIIDLYK